MQLAESKTLSIPIARSLREVYDFTASPASFGQWASGLGKPLGSEGNGANEGNEDNEDNGANEHNIWRFEGETGPVTIRFTGRNAFGILDHYVVLPDGSEIYVPMRVVANGAGSEVLFTLFRVPGMDDEKFAADAQWVMRDLTRLKALLEAR